MSAPRRRIAGAFALAAFVVALALASCGKNGAPDPPPGVRNTYPRAYPSG